MFSHTQSQRTPNISMSINDDADDNHVPGLLHLQPAANNHNFLSFSEYLQQQLQGSTVDYGQLARGGGFNDMMRTSTASSFPSLFDHDHILNIHDHVFAGPATSGDGKIISSKAMDMNMGELLMVSNMDSAAAAAGSGVMTPLTANSSVSSSSNSEATAAGEENSARCNNNKDIDDDVDDDYQAQKNNNLEEDQQQMKQAADDHDNGTTTGGTGDKSKKL